MFFYEGLQKVGLLAQVDDFMEIQLCVIIDFAYFWNALPPAPPCMKWVWFISENAVVVQFLAYRKQSVLKLSDELI